MLPVSSWLWMALARPALVLKSDDPSEIPRKMRRRPSSQDQKDVVSWFFHDFVPISFKSEEVKWSEVGAARSQHVSGVIAGDSRVAWYKDPYHLYGWVSVTDVEPFSWKVSWLDLAKNGHGVRGNSDRRWSFHILDCLQGIPDSFQLHPGAARKHVVCSSSLLDKFTIAENAKPHPA